MSRRSRRSGRLWLLLLCLSSSGCMSMLQPSAAYQANAQQLALAPLVVYQGASGPLSYQAAVGRDGLKSLPTTRVRGRACQRGIQLPIFSVIAASLSERNPVVAPGLSAGWGDGSYQAAVDDARRKLPSGSILFDVRADLQQRAILTVYREQCVLIDAGVLLPVPAA